MRFMGVSGSKKLEFDHTYAVIRFNRQNIFYEPSHDDATLKRYYPVTRKIFELLAKALFNCDEYFR